MSAWRKPRDGLLGTFFCVRVFVPMLGFIEQWMPVPLQVPASIVIAFVAFVVCTLEYMLRWLLTPARIWRSHG